MRQILVLGGGISPEREVSLRSAKAVAEAARQVGHEVAEADPADGLEIFKKVSKETIVLPILHGEGGEDGSIQSELEKNGLAFLGADSESSKRCFDKWLSRLDLEKSGISMPKAELVDEQSYNSSPLIKSPHVLKIVNGGSSIGTLVIRDFGSIDHRLIDELFELGKKAVVEELIEGIELTVPILDTKALPPIEIIPPPEGVFDYENKYNGKSQELCPAVNITKEQEESAKKIAEKVHRVMKCRHLSRVDIMMDSYGKHFVLEINTIPGLTSQSLYPKSAQCSGLPMPKLVNKFIELIARDYSL